MYLSSVLISNIINFTEEIKRSWAIFQTFLYFFFLIALRKKHANCFTPWVPATLQLYSTPKTQDQDFMLLNILCY